MYVQWHQDNEGRRNVKALPTNNGALASEQDALHYQFTRMHDALSRACHTYLIKLVKRLAMEPRRKLDAARRNCLSTTVLLWHYRVRRQRTTSYVRHSQPIYPETGLFRYYLGFAWHTWRLHTPPLILLYRLSEMEEGGHGVAQAADIWLLFPEDWRENDHEFSSRSDFQLGRWTDGFLDSLWPNHLVIQLLWKPILIHSDVYLDIHTLSAPLSRIDCLGLTVWDYTSWDFGVLQGSTRTWRQGKPAIKYVEEMNMLELESGTK